MRSINPHFYKTKLWNNVRKSIWIKQYCLCNICNRPVYVDGISEWIPKEKRLKGIVHHKIFLNEENYTNDEIAYDEANLEGICVECHNKIHMSTDITRKDVMFDEEGNLIKR